ncbi:MAG TPA: choice-of-anchor D domain-containing protein [Terriglobia bacterium]|nr:choice-of-anchor D domain-containing protein [Terriglobia bacterium]
MNKTLFFALFASSIPLAYADQGSLINSGGSASAGAGVSISSTVANPAGTVTLNCPATGNNGCTGGSFTFLSTDETSSINALFTSGTATESCYGGGRGGHLTCTYSLTAYFSGTWTVNTVTQAIVGVTSQYFETIPVATAASGTSVFNSAYTPFYYSDSGAILRSDDLQGTNQITYYGPPGDPGLYGAYGIALDSSGRIYVADTYHCRIVRMDDINGTNWTTYGGACGSAQGQFYDPQGIAVDSTGKIYVMDTGNSRLVRVDDMTGANWITYGTPGSGVGQFNAFLWVAVDSSNRIYVADAGNLRIVRMDDMVGTNWTVLTGPFVSPVAVAIDSAGKIYIADNNSAARVIRVDDMTGANWTSIPVSAVGSTGLNSIAVNSTGTVFTGGGGVRAVDSMAGVLYSSGDVGPVGSYYVFGVTPVPVSSPPPSAISFSPPTLTFSQNVGTTSAAQPVAISNFGGRTLNVSSVSANGAFSETNTCGSPVLPGANCTVNVTFTPTAAGTANGVLTLTDDSGNLGATQTVALTGLGTTPGASVTPAKISFPSQVVGTTGASQNVVLKSTGDGPLQISSVTVGTPFSETNSCPASIAAGSSCTISVSFTPTVAGSASGTLTIVDNAGTQTVSLTGTGLAQVSFSPSTLSFGTVVVGNTSASKKVTVTNNGSAVTLSSVSTSAGFAVASNTCGTSLAAGAKCTVGVTFSPTAVGSATGTLTFTDSAPDSPQTVSLTGSGSAPVSFSSSTLSFGTVKVGTTSVTKTVTVTNHLSASLSFSSIAASAGFAVASNTCGASVAAGAKCTVGVTFSPTATGATTGTLTFTDSALTSPQTVGLTGTGN